MSSLAITAYPPPAYPRTVSCDLRSNTFRVAGALLRMPFAMDVVDGAFAASWRNCAAVRGFAPTVHATASINDIIKKCLFIIEVFI